MRYEAEFTAANSSGFPLQIAVQHAVESTSTTHGWTVHYVEHAWTDPDTGASGFLDLVLRSRSGAVNLVVECKKVHEGFWLFMRADGTEKQRSHAKAWLTVADQSRITFAGWANAQIEPRSFEASFCAPSKGDILERIGGPLVRATECLALEELNFRRVGVPSTRIYVSVIVTNAPLKVVKFDPGSMLLSDGRLPKDAEFSVVPHLRLRKQMRAQHVALSAADYAAGLDVAYDNESTIFVVSAEGLCQMLSEFGASYDQLPAGRQGGRKRAGVFE